MNQPSDQTIRYYDEHADEFIRRTVGLSMGSLYQPFLELVPAGGTILDAGCGSGRDTKAFLEFGYEVVAIDASPRMVAAATRLTGRPARRLRFEEVDYENQFDGVWARASLLHLPRGSTDDVFEPNPACASPRGVCYMSFKEGDGDRVDVDHRHYTDFTATSLQAVLVKVDVIRIWTGSDDVNPDLRQRWVNALVRKD